MIRPLGIHYFLSEDWKQATLQLLLLSQVELAISANYLCGYFCLPSKQKSGDRQWSAAGWELKESPLCAQARSWYTPAVNWSHHTDPSFNAVRQKTAAKLHLIGLIQREIKQAHFDWGSSHWFLAKHSPVSWCFWRFTSRKSNFFTGVSVTDCPIVLQTIVCFRMPKSI